MSSTAYLAAGLAVAAVSAPVLRAAGVPVPVHVTAAHRAAMAVLDEPVLGVAAKAKNQNTAMNRILEITRALRTTSGEIAGLPNFAALSPGDFRTLGSAVVAAVQRGVAIGGFKVAAAGGVDAGSILDGIADIGCIFSGSCGAVDTVQELVDDLETFNALTAGTAVPSSRLTELGRALQDVVTHHNNAFLALLDPSVFDVGAAQLAVGKLAIEIDGQGFLEFGAPDFGNKPLTEYIAEAPGVLAGWVGGAATDIAGTVVGDIVGGILRSPLFWAGGLAFVAWKVLR